MRLIDNRIHHRDTITSAFTRYAGTIQRALRYGNGSKWQVYEKCSKHCRSQWHHQTQVRICGWQRRSKRIEVLQYHGFHRQKQQRYIKCDQPDIGARQRAKQGRRKQDGSESPRSARQVRPQLYLWQEQQSFHILGSRGGRELSQEQSGTVLQRSVPLLLETATKGEVFGLDRLLGIPQSRPGRVRSIVPDCRQGVPNDPREETTQ